jgi:AraC-like DNA-binding protein
VEIDLLGEAPLFDSLPGGLEHCEAQAAIPRHFHANAYLALVIRGGYMESGNRGRFRVGEGDILLHRRFDSHFNRIGDQGATILNLPLQSAPVHLAAARVSDIDRIVRTSEADPQAAVDLIFEQLEPLLPGLWDWPDLLARDLMQDQSCRLEDWGYAHGMVPETISRGFMAAFGTTAADFRAEERARRAYESILHTPAPFAEIAAATGFSDQAHMTRAVRALTGASPRVWRSSL